MTRALIKLAQPGFDVETSGDENLVFSSEWPLLKIYLQGSFTIPDVTKSTVITTHDLGFTPMYWFFTNDTIAAWKNSGTLASDTRSEFFGPTGGGTISMNGTQMLFTPTAFTATGSLTIYYYIFAIDITKQFTAPINRVGSTPAFTSKNFVMKISKPGKNIKSNVLKDFVIRSDCRSPLVHSVNPGTVNTNLGGGNFGFSVVHNLTYLPMFFGYTLSGGYYTLMPTGSGGSTIFSSTTINVAFQEGSSGRQMTIVILKDPFLLSYSVSVTV